MTAAPSPHKRPMVPEDEARRIALDHVAPLGVETVELEAALGYVLAESVVSDTDMPPFDRAAMDGYAVRFADVACAGAEFDVIESIKAGEVAQRRVEAGQGIEIMTGAPAPAGAEAVIPVESTEVIAEGRVRVVKPLDGKSNIAERGEDLRCGDAVLEAGRVLRPSEIGLAAMVGHRRLTVYRRPRVALLATGNELVAPDEPPGPGRTRNCNNYTLLAECARLGVPAVNLGIARDTPHDLERAIRAGLEGDVLITSGGVSAGKHDLVLSAFDACGIAVHFSRVAIQPGMPTVFGSGKGDGSRLCEAPEGPTGKRLPSPFPLPASTAHSPPPRIIWGLPGNPAAVPVVFHLLVAPTLRRLAGHTKVGPHFVPATLTAPVAGHGRRRTYRPARLHHTEAGLTADPLPTHGSADLMAVTRAEAFIQLEPGRETPAGAIVPTLLVES